MAYGHGKVILFGEHSVVHGRPALARAVSQGVEVRALESPASVTTLHIDPWQVDLDTGAAPNRGHEALQRALKIARGFYPDAPFELTLRADVRLPGGAGMGSSAAIGVAVLRAMDEAYGQARTDVDVFQRSLDWEKVFHGNPSGVDNAMATYGGTALYVRGQPLAPVTQAQPIQLLAAYSGPSPSTEKMVSLVKQQLDADPVGVGGLFDEIADIVQRGKSALERGDTATLGSCMNDNHQRLIKLKLSTDKLNQMVAAACSAGALGAKLTGGGGGGCMLALVDGPDAHAAVSHALKAYGPVYDV
jgi:mevalonate kinase